MPTASLRRPWFLLGHRLARPAVVFGVVAVASVLAHLAALPASTADPLTREPLPAVVEAQGGTWSMLASLRGPRMEAASAELDGLLYVVGGIDAERNVVGTVDVYDIGAGQWRQAAPLPEALNHSAAVALDGKVYVVGGYVGAAPGERQAVDSLWAYDPVADRWERRAALPVGRAALAAVVLGNRLYAVGGERSHLIGGRVVPESVSDLTVYDPADDRWEPLPPMHHPRNHLVAAVIDGRLYAVGGRDESTFIMDSVEAYDSTAATWSERAAMPTARSGSAGAAVGDRLFVFGGEGNQRSPQGIFDDVEAYEPSRDAWTRLAPMPVPRHGLAASVQGVRVYLPGGSTVQGFGPTATVDAFTVTGR